MYDTAVVTAANVVVQQALSDCLAAAGTPHATVTVAPAGAGKSYVIGSGVGLMRAAGLRTAVCAPTNEQVFALVRQIAARYPQEIVTVLPASSVVPPADLRTIPNVQIAPSGQAAQHATLLLGTFDKLGDAFSRDDLQPFDVLLADEAYQADAARYFAVAGLAPTHLLVGDPGQLDPFATIAADRWRGLPEDPLQTAVGILRRNHPTMPLHRLPITRRLDPRAVPIAQSFYPDHPFSAAVLPGVRQLRLLPAIAATHRMAVIDHALAVAAQEGWAHVELPDAAVLTADPATIDLIVAIVQRLFTRAPSVRCERMPDWSALARNRVAVGVSHNDQKDRLRLALDGVGLQQVVVDTANKLQGREFDVAIVWHPLAGLPDPDAFHVDPGRLCVLLTRHRHACIVVGRTGDRTLLDDLPPSTPVYLDWNPDPVLDGWAIHREIFERLAPYRIAA